MSRQGKPCIFQRWCWYDGWRHYFFGAIYFWNVITKEGA